MGFGNLEQKEKLAAQLKNIDSMTDTEKTTFFKKMKKFSNVSKLADDVDKMKV